jgi:hypothetical protein
MVQDQDNENRQKALQVRDTRVFAFMDQLEKANSFPAEIRDGVVKMLNEKIKYMMDWETAEMISSSELVPKDYVGKPNNVFLAIQTGRSLGLDPFQSVKHLYTVNGRTSLYGDMMLALVKDHKEYEDCKEEFGDMIDAGNNHGMLPKFARCTIKRKGKSDIVREYTIEDAMRNPNFNTFNKNYSTNKYDQPGTWMRNGKRMMQMRARSFALRDAFPDKLSGVYDEYEIQEIHVTKDITDQVEDIGKKQGASGLKSDLMEKEIHEDENVSVGEEKEEEAVEEQKEPENLQEMLETMKGYFKQKKITKKDFNKFCEYCDLGEWEQAIEMHDSSAKKFGEFKEIGEYAGKLQIVVDNPDYKKAINNLIKEGKIKRPDEKQNVLRTKDEKLAKEVFELIEQYKGFEDAEKKGD